MSIFTVKLGDYGVNIPETLPRFLGDEGFYCECINAFKREDDFALLEEKVREKAYSEAFDVAHTLKGVTANLGLTPLFLRLSDLVEDLRNNIYDNAEKKTNAIIKEFENFKNIDFSM